VRGYKIAMIQAPSQPLFGVGTKEFWGVKEILEVAAYITMLFIKW